MNYIDRLKRDNVTFRIINEKEADIIMKREYSYYDLLNYSLLFEKYKTGEKKGLFVSLDFSQLYYLAEIDFHFCQILMCMCLEIEKKLKGRLLSDAEKNSVTNKLIYEYYYSDREYIDNTYTPEKNDMMCEYIKVNSVLDMELNQFLDVIQFGTLEKLIYFFYSQYQECVHDEDFAVLKSHLSSVRKIRNIVAHNSSIINKLRVTTEYKNLKMRSFLGKNGINSRTLKTNMSKAVINDLSGFFYVYFNILGNTNMIDIIDEFDNTYCKKHMYLFENNYLLMSSYNFIKRIINIFRKNT